METPRGFFCLGTQGDRARWGSGDRVWASDAAFYSYRRICTDWTGRICIPLFANFFYLLASLFDFDSLLESTSILSSY